jgi:hypothetical protein
MAKLKMSVKARTFMGRKIGLLTKEGYAGKQKIAIAYSMARAKGYKISKRR